MDNIPGSKNFAFCVFRLGESDGFTKYGNDNI